jgi:hypothetical protein
MDVGGERPAARRGGHGPRRVLAPAGTLSVSGPRRISGATVHYLASLVRHARTMTAVHSDEPIRVGDRYICPECRLPLAADVTTDGPMLLCTNATGHASGKARQWPTPPEPPRRFPDHPAYR